MSDANGATSQALFASAVAAAQRKGVVVSDSAPPASRTCLTNGLALHFLDWQGDAKHTLLLLHGALLHAHVWDFFSLGMRQRFRIRALDLPGHGDSDWATDEDYSRARVADDVATFVEQLDLTSTVLIGHSFGGAVGALVAARLAHRVRALVMVDSTLLPSGRQSVRGRAAALPRNFASFEELAQHAAGLGQRADRARPSAGLRWNARQLADGRWSWKYDPALRHSVLGPPDFSDVWNALGAYRGPVLFVRAGEHSHLADEAAERLRTLRSVRLVVVPAARHNVMTDNAVEFTRVVSEFLVDLHRDGRTD